MFKFCLFTQTQEQAALVNIQKRRKVLRVNLWQIP
jgi:hypothetical protein